MNPSDWTELVKELGQLKMWLVCVIAGAFLFWLLATLVRTWWNHCERQYQEQREAVKEDARIRREDEREHRLGTRLDELNKSQCKAYEEVIKPTVAVMTATQMTLNQFMQATRNCPGTDKDSKPPGV